MRLIFTLLLSVTLLLSCSKDTETATDDISLAPDDVVLSSGTFADGLHNVSGFVKLIKDNNGRKFLLLSNFKFDTGPDLRLYLSASKRDDDYTEITDSPKQGDVRLEVPSAANTDTQTQLLVWCEQYSVLFGFAELKQ